MKPKPPSVFTKEARARISRTDRDEVERRVEAFLKGVAQALPARRIVRAIRLDATETDFLAINDFLNDAYARAPAEVREFMEFLDEQGGFNSRMKAWNDEAKRRKGVA